MLNYGVKMRMFAIIFLIFFSCSHVSWSYKILAVLPFPSKSHYAIADPLLVKLAELGHDVTVYSPYPKKDKISNYEEVDIGQCFSFSMDMLTIDYLVSRGSNPFLNLLIPFLSYLFVNFDNCEPLMMLLNSTKNYDVLITETFRSDAMLMFAGKFKIPTITFIPNTMLPWLSNRMGNPDNPAYVPHVMSPYSTRMMFLERVENTLLYIASMLPYEYYISKVDDTVLHKYVESSPSI